MRGDPPFPAIDARRAAPTRQRAGAGAWRRLVIAGAATAAALLLAGIGLGVWALVIEPDRLVVREMRIATPKWPADLAPLRIAAIGDLHAGAPHIDAAKIDAIIARIEAARPDVIVLLGDFLIQNVRFGRPWAPRPMAERLGRLAAPLGVYAVLGNHDWYAGGWPMWQALEAAGIPVLENRSIALPGNRIWLAGIADDTTRTPDAAGAVAGIPPRAAVIALAHDPAVFPDIPARVALTLSGHTHAGQVRLPFFGALYNASRAPLDHSYGHIRDGDADLVVTAGIGTSILPVRFNAPPEILLIDIGHGPATPAPASPGG